MTQRILVRFEGPGEGVEDLTWGQRSSWASMLLGGGTVEWTGGTMPLAEGTTADEIATLLGFIMSRHESLRTRFRVEADGTPRQVLAAAGEITLDVVDADESEDPAQVAELVRERYEAADWDFATDWPIRMAVIRRHGVAVHFVALYSHLVIDGYGFDALVADLVNLDTATGRHLAPVEGMQPREQAVLQRSPLARRQCAATLRHWERQLRTIEPRRFGESTDKREPRYWEASYTSPATYLALPAVAERAKVHTGTVLLAAYAIAIARISGNPSSTIRTLVSNRFRPGFAQSVSAVMQSALCVIDCADATFDEVVARAFKTQLAAGMYAYYNPPELWALIDRVNLDRGVKIDLMCYFNDRRKSLARAMDDPTATRDEIVAAMPRSTMRWGPKTSDPDATCYLHVNTVPDTIDYTLLVDTHRVSPADMEGLLRGIEATIVEAAFDPTMSSGIRPVSVPVS